MWPIHRGPLLPGVFPGLFLNNTWCFWMSLCFQTRGQACLQRDFSQEGLINNAHGPSLYPGCVPVSEAELGELSCTSWSSKFPMLELSVSGPRTSLHLKRRARLSVVPGQVGGAETCI